MESDDDNHNMNIYFKFEAYLRILKNLRRCAFVRFKLLI